MTAAMATSPFRAREPVAKRLNKNALLVVLALASVTAGVAVVSLAPRRRAMAGTEVGDTSGAAAPVRPQRPALPARPMVFTQPAVAGSGGSVVPPAIALEQQAAPSRGGMHSGRTRSAGREPPGDAPYARALVSGLIVGDGRTRTDTVPASSAAASTNDSATAPTPALMGPTPDAPSARDGPSGRRDPDAERAAFLVGATREKDQAIAPSIERPVSPFELEAGTVIPAELVTDVNSDLPGAIVGQVSRDVYDSRTESTVLVPKGTRLIGTYDARVVEGQSRVLVAWTRMVLPDGRGVTLPVIEGVDAMGAAGVEGSVNRHLGHVFVNAALMSALSAGAQLSQPQEGGGAYAVPSAGQVAAGAMGQELSTVGLEMVRRGLDVKPTITVRGGGAVQVLLTQDVVFPSAYVDAR